jgi:hypothetical protein
MAHREEFTDEELQAHATLAQMLRGPGGRPPDTYTIDVDLVDPDMADTWVLTCNGLPADDLIGMQGDRINWHVVQDDQKCTIVFKGVHWPFLGQPRPLTYPGAPTQKVAGGEGVGDYDYSINVNGVVKDPRIIAPGPGTP